VRRPAPPGRSGAGQAAVTGGGRGAGGSRRVPRGGPAAATGRTGQRV